MIPWTYPSLYIWRLGQDEFWKRIISQSRVETNRMTVDESFKKPGAVPFKWETRPGVPKTRTDGPDHHLSKRQEFHSHGDEEDVSEQSLPPPQKLKPPPSRLHFLPRGEPGSCSFRSAPQARSNRWHASLPELVRPICVSPGCFPTSSILRRKSMSKPDHFLLYPNTPARRSASSTKSLPSSCNSPSTSYFSVQSSPKLSISSYSYLSSRSPPQTTVDANWEGFGLPWGGARATDPSPSFLCKRGSIDPPGLRTIGLSFTDKF